MKSRPAKKAAHRAEAEDRFLAPSRLHFATPSCEIYLFKESAPDKIQLFRVGLFHHDEHGEIPVTAEMLAEMIQNYRDDVRGVDLAIDYAHESGWKAAGWIKDIFFNEDETELWARVAWTPAGREAVESAEFRYVSPDFGFASQDKETLQWFGPTLNGAGLTNRPFIKRMAPMVQLSESTTENDMTLEEAKKTIKELEGQVKKLGEDGSQMADKAAKGDALQKQCDDAGMTPEQMMAKIKELQDQLAATNAQMADFKKKAGDATLQAQEATKKAEFDVLLTEGKACEAQRDPFMKGDTVQFAKLAEKPKLKRAGTGEAGVDELKTGEEVQKEISKRAEVLLSEKKVSSLGDGIRMVLNEHKDLAAKYHQTA